MNEGIPHLSHFTPGLIRNDRVKCPVIPTVGRNLINFIRTLLKKHHLAVKLISLF